MTTCLIAGICQSCVNKNKNESDVLQDILDDQSKIIERCVRKSIYHHERGDDVLFKHYKDSVLNAGYCSIVILNKRKNNGK